MPFHWLARRGGRIRTCAQRQAGGGGSQQAPRFKLPSGTCCESERGAAQEAQLCESDCAGRASGDCDGRASDSGRPNGWYGMKDERRQRFEHASPMHPSLQGGTVGTFPNKILHVL